MCMKWTEIMDLTTSLFSQVAVVTVLRCRTTSRCVCVAATHLKARSGWEWLRSAQGSDLLRHLQNLLQKHSSSTTAEPSSDVPLLICGDFNAVPAEDVYRRFISSPLGLDSAYKKLSKDGLTEPEYTTWKIRPTGECCTTLDYIWYTQDSLKVDSVLDMPTEEQIGPNRLPSFSYPSDHLSLVCDFSFKEEERSRSFGVKQQQWKKKRHRTQSGKWSPLGLCIRNGPLVAMWSV